LDLVQVGARWLHLVATVALIGYYAALGALVVPALRGAMTPRVLGESIAAPKGCQSTTRRQSPGRARS